VIPAPAWSVPRWTIAAYAYACVSAAIVGYFIAGIPLQVTDNLRALLLFEHTTLGQLLVDQLRQPGFFRPLLWLPAKLLFDVAGGHHFLVYKAFHIAELAAVCLLLVHLARVRTAVDFAALALAIAVLLGLHTFPDTVREGFPVNTHMTILVCCLAAAALAFRDQSRWWIDVTVIALLMFAMLSVETGLLVWVITAGAYMLGARGVSARGVAAATLVLAAYFAVRFLVLDVGAPDLSVRTSGFGFRALDPPELMRRFGDHPLAFYAYNVAASVLTVLLSEPRAGVWHTTRSLVGGQVSPWQVVHLTSSLATAAILVLHIRTRWPEWRRRQWDRCDRLFLLFPIVLAANAAISYPYLKDGTMSPAGVFYALATLVAVRAVLYRAVSLSWTGVRHAAVTAALVLASIMWTVREGGTCFVLRRTAWITRGEWAYVTSAWLEKRELLPRDRAGRELLLRLQYEALRHPVAIPFFAQRWAVVLTDPLY